MIDLGTAPGYPTFLPRRCAIVLAILLLAGAPRAGASACTSDADCDTFCYQGTCAVTCSSDADCDPNTHCLPDLTARGAVYEGGTCAVSTCTSDADCNPNNKCFPNVMCNSGTCEYDPQDCDDADPCTIDNCAAATGCNRVDIDCNDSDPCTLDYCSQGDCHNEPRSSGFCDDGNACTTDSCEPTMGCVHTPFCTGTPGPMITGGAAVGSTRLTAQTGSCVPGALAVFLCSSNGFGPCHTAGDMQIAGATFTPPNPSSPLSVVTIVLPSPPAPLIAGQKLYFTDGCTDPLLSAAATVSEPVPVMSAPMILLLTASLGLIALLAFSRERWKKG